MPGGRDIHAYSKQSQRGAAICAFATGSAAEKMKFAIKFPDESGADKVVIWQGVSARAAAEDFASAWQYRGAVTLWQIDESVGPVRLWTRPAYVVSE